MKYLKQFGIILILSFSGELLNLLIPLPIPASIWGFALMFVCLQTGFLKLDYVKDTAIFLIEIMPLMFIPAAVGLMESWGIIRAKIIPYLVITVLSTFLVMAAAGKITQAVIRRDRKKACHHE
jgi:holin-like protein